MKGMGEGMVTATVEHGDAGSFFSEFLSHPPFLLEGNVVMQRFLMCIFPDATVGFELLIVCA